MLENQKTLKNLIEEFNLILENNYKKEVGRIDVTIGRNGVVKNYLKNKYEVKCESLNDLISSSTTLLINDSNISNLFINFLKSQTDYKTNFEIMSSTLSSKEFRNVITLSIYNFKEEIYNYKNSDLKRTFNSSNRVIIKYKTKNITLRDCSYNHSTEEVKNIISIELHNVSSEYENLTLNEILLTIIKESKIVKDYEQKQIEDRNNKFIENRRKFEEKLKELNITEEDFKELSLLNRN